MDGEISLILVAVAATLTAVATGLGALPLLVLRDASARTLGMSNAFAGGLMLAATQLLLLEGVDIDASRTAWGAIGGVVAIALVARFVHASEDDGDGPEINRLRGATARTAFLIIAVMTAHSAAEGIGVGVSFGGGEDLGILVALAIAIHNIPEGLAISLALIPSGATVRSAAGWSVFSSLPQPLLAIPAFLFVDAFREVLPVGLGVAGGAMLWMVLFELLPEAMGRARWPFVAIGLVVGYLVMFGFTVLLGGG